MEDLRCSSTQSDSGGHVLAVLRSACHHEGPRLIRQKRGRNLGSVVMVISVQSHNLRPVHMSRNTDIVFPVSLFVVSYQTDWVRKAVLKAVFLEQLPEVRDVAGCEPERVQFRQFGVGRDPGQAGLQPGEGFAQHPHPRSLPGVGRVPLRLTRVLVRRSGDPALMLDPPHLRAVIVQLLIRVPAGVVAGDFARRPLQDGGGGSSGTRLVVLRVARSRAGGHVAAPPALLEGRPGDPSATLGSLKLHSMTVLPHESLYDCVQLIVK